MYYLRRRIFSIYVITSLLVISATSINYFATTTTTTITITITTTTHSEYGQAIQSSSWK